MKSPTVVSYVYHNHCDNVLALVAHPYYSALIDSHCKPTNGDRGYGKGKSNLQVDSHLYSVSLV